MNENANHVTIGVTSNTQQAANQPPTWYYEQMAKQQAAFDSNYLTPPDSLETLYNRTCRLNRLFIALNRPWTSGSGEIQKACAHYLIHADLSKKSRNAFIHVMGDIAQSVCHLAACSDFIAQMQRYYHNQEKQLKQLLDDRKQEEQKQEEPPAPEKEAETAYCITIGSREIYGVTHQQLQELHQTAGRFIEREKAPFECKVEDYGEHPVSISKSVDLCAGDDRFSIDYSLDAPDLELCCLSAAQMQRIADTISGFLKEFGENGDRNVRWDMVDYPDERITFEVEANSKQPAYMAAPWISKCIKRKENGETEISYFIDINEIHSPDLSFGEFITIYRKLDHFLKNPARANKINH